MYKFLFNFDSHVTTFSGLFVATITVILVWYFKYKDRKNLPPGPWNFPIIGYLPFLGPQPQETFLQLRSKYGDIFTVQMGSFTVVVLNGKDMIKKAILNSGGVFDSRPEFFSFSLVKERLALGQHNDRRTVFKKIVINKYNAFINNKYYSIASLLTDEAAMFIADIMKHAGMPFDPKNDIYVSFCSVLYQICYGKGNNIREDGDFLEFTVREKEFIDFATSGNPAEVMPWLSRVFPSLVAPVYSILNFTKCVREKKLQEHKSTFDKDNIRDLTDSLIELQDETAEMRKVGLTFEHLTTVLDEIIPAGFDTTATSMRWILLFLINFPHVERKLYDEIESVIGNRVPTMIDRDNMPYTEAVILEALRFKTPIPLALPHAAVEDARLGGYDIPKGIAILINLHSLTRDSTMWTFPNSFYPEHFLTSDGTLDREKAMFIHPFGLGQRKCIGEQLARSILFMSLVNIVQRFKILPVAGELYDMIGVNGLTDCPKTFKVIAKLR